MRYTRTGSKWQIFDNSPITAINPRRTGHFAESGPIRRPEQAPHLLRLLCLPSRLLVDVLGDVI